MPIEDVKPAIKAIAEKWLPYDTLTNYYEGDHKLKFSTDKLRNAFGKFGVYFAENWLAVVIDSVLDRLTLKGFTITGNKELTAQFALFFKEQKLALIADDVHQSANIVGEAFIIMQKVDNVISSWFNEPDMCVIFYDDLDPNKKTYAARLYETDDKWKVILYYPTKIERYEAPKPKREKKDVVQFMASLAWQPDPEKPTADNPYGKIPVFHFRNTQNGKKDIDMGPAERSMQDAINILFSNMMVASEFNSMKQRYIISQADPGDLENRPGELWWLPAGDGQGEQTKTGEFAEGDLQHFYATIEKIAQALGIITRTPKHYFYSTGNDPSGEALMTMEAPLVKKTERRKANYDVTWIEVAAFSLELLGKTVLMTDITSQWGPVPSVQPLTEAQIIKTEKEATIPLKTSVRRRGWTQEEIDQMEKDKKEEQQAMTNLAQTELDLLRKKDATSNKQPDGSGDE